MGIGYWVLGVGFIKKVEALSETKKPVKQKRKPNGQQLVLFGTLLIIAFFFLWWIGVGVKNFIVSELVTVESLQYDKIQQDLVVDATVFRKEAVVQASQGGKLVRKVAEGVRVRKGKQVASIIAATVENSSGSVEIPLRSDFAGVISYQVDGLEATYTPENVEKFGPERLASLQLRQEPVASEQISSGQAAFKIIDNLATGYLYLKLNKSDLDAEYLKQCQPGNYLTVQVGKDVKSRKYQWLIKQVYTQESEIHVLLSVPDLPEAMYTKRQVPVRIISKQYSGFIIPKAALVEKEGKPGIFLVYKQSVLWQPVEVKGTIGDQAAIQPPKDKPRSKVTANSTVITNPQYVHEGQPIR